MEILQIGPKFVAFHNYGEYRVDSVLATMDTSTLTTRYYYDLLRKYPAICTPASLIIDQKANECTFAEPFALDMTYKYTEPLPTIRWEKATGEIKEILGHKCLKATCRFRGRNWTVWYAPDIKTGYGPWKLAGLPGLILYAADDSGQHVFEAVAIRKKPSVIHKGKYIVQGKQTGRKEYNEWNSKNKRTALDGMWNAYYEDPLNHPKPAFKHYPDIPLELE